MALSARQLVVLGCLVLGRCPVSVSMASSGDGRGASTLTENLWVLSGEQTGKIDTGWKTA